ncbi:MAG: FtsX-like permease family protein [Chloroflexota bacterium]
MNGWTTPRRRSWARTRATRRSAPTRSGRGRCSPTPPSSRSCAWRSWRDDRRGPRARRELSIGKEITIGGIPFNVIGILQSKGSTTSTSADDQILVPVSTLKKYFTGSASTGVRSIGVSVATAAQMESVKAEITTLLEDRHNIASTGTDDFSVADQTQLLSTATSVYSLLTVLLAGVASISLIVGGIGIMNIMLVSVRERTREIGIRKAIGAKNRDILAQFLVEALVLSILGGLIGIALGLVASAVIGGLAGWGFVFNPITPAATLFSLVVGVVFGVRPARQAAKLNPIAALRFE